MATANNEVRDQVRAAVLAEVERVGVGALRRDVIVTRFSAAGVTKSTLYRWIDAVLKSGMPGQRLARKIKAASARRAVRSDEPAADAAEEVAQLLPAVPRVDAIVTEGAVPLMEQLKKCLDLAHRIIKHAEAPDGTIRNARLILNASEYLRRTIETAARLQEAIFNVEEMERFQTAVIDAVRQCSPEAAERILHRIGQECESAIAA